MHEEKNIDTVIQSIFMLRGTGQVEPFRRCCSSLHIFQLSFGCIGLVLTKTEPVKNRDDCCEEFTVEELDDRLVNHSETINCGVALSSSFLE